ncbi:MAG: hypothetical protein NZT61_01155 [Deltaproteobacteria bacterium]|nr:hypothetical protein [Deltaproteobacteria bacterium]
MPDRDIVQLLSKSSNPTRCRGPGFKRIVGGLEAFSLNGLSTTIAGILEKTYFF